ncbi:MAG: sigma-70 family RNA polymerase sigma factor [Verrucomicrobiota bacterium]
MSGHSQNLPQLYRFCFLMTGDGGKAQEAFQSTVREAARRTAEGEPPPDRFWFFREARWRCLAVGDEGIQAEDVEMEEVELSADAAEQLAQLDGNQLAIWIAGAPEPQRTALALFYLDEFDHRELRALLGIKTIELSALLARARRQFQAWLDAVVQIEAR